jgi:hypothetical protein
MATGKSVQAFNADLTAVSEQLDISLDKVVRKVVFDIHKAVSDLSPVRTGRFRASWGISPLSVPDDPGEPDSKGTSVPISNQKKRMNTSTPDPLVVWFIYNNLPYAQKLEDGSSQQSPAGIMNLALATVEAEIDTILG